MIREKGSQRGGIRQSPGFASGRGRWHFDYVLYMQAFEIPVMLVLIASNAVP